MTRSGALALLLCLAACGPAPDAEMDGPAGDAARRGTAVDSGPGGTAADDPGRPAGDSTGATHNAAAPDADRVGVYGRRAWAARQDSLDPSIRTLVERAG
ncbi:MAG TPA: hypothetical protein VK966_13615, partial [Longimicrobiales bacterium]|nr:hypothetical protein [Longimicrobiales bacterium]